MSDSHLLLRVWWIGTGIASSLAFHAAGQNTKGIGNTENTLSQIILSYTSTIKTLSHARSRASTAATISRKKTSILVVTMPTTPRNASLPGVDREKLGIQQMNNEFYKIKALENPTAKDVLENMSRFDIIHFACHGIVDPKDPSNSHLLLQKIKLLKPVVDKLTVSEIRKKPLLGEHGLPIYLHTQQQELRQKNLLMNASIFLAPFR